MLFMNVISYTQLFLAIVASMFAILVPVALSNVWYIYIFFASRFVWYKNQIYSKIPFRLLHQNQIFGFKIICIRLVVVSLNSFSEWKWLNRIFVLFSSSPGKEYLFLKIGRAIDLGMQPKVWFNGEVHSIIKFKIFILFSWIMRTHIHPSMPPSEILFRIRFVLYSLGYDTRWTLPNNENQNVLLFSFLFFVQVLFLASK